MPDDESTARTLLDLCPDAYVELDSHGVITDWNAAAESLFGWSRAETIGQPGTMVVPERLRGMYQRVLSAFFGANASVLLQPFPGRAVRKDGHEFPLEARAREVKRGGGPHLGAFVRDLTLQKRLEAALHDSEQRSQAIVDTIEDGYCEVDLRGHFLNVNDAYCRMFNRTKEQALGISYKQMFAADRIDMVRAAYQQVYQTGQPVKSFEYESSPGRFLEQSISLKRNAKGEPSGFVSVIRDCTQRKLYERELAQAKETAEAASRAKSEFLANMSHEIRTPMNGILGMTELALATGLSEEQREFLNMVKASADALLVIINDILDYSKIEAGKVTLDPAPLHLSEFVGDVMKSMSVLAHKKGLELAFHLDRQVPSEVVADAARLRQVLLNLVGNAIKFTDTGEVVLDVQVEERAETEVRLRFSVRDTGIGVAPEKQARIFQPFEQGDTSTTRQFGGTGLGLTISKWIVQLMNGRMWLESAPGEGSTFHFTACFGLGAAPAPHVSAPAEDLAGLPVLVIDDNGTNRRILEEQLRSWDMQPQLAASGEAGLATLEAAWRAGKPFRLILLDEQMPGMSGLEVIRQIRARASLRGAAIMMLTSSGQSSSAEQCREMGVEFYLTKPIKPAELLLTIRKALREQPVAAAPDGVPAWLAPGQQSLAVLVAEDNFVNQRVAAGMLERMGHRPTVAVSGLEALAKWCEGGYDAILMDVQMPGMDGFEASRRIREKEQGQGARIPIIAMTAHAMNGDRERCLAAGMDDYITKPVAVQALQQALARCQKTR